MTYDFPAYARVFHPVIRVNKVNGEEDKEEELTWSYVCKITGRTAHASMQWESIAGSLAHGNSPLWSTDPWQGSLTRNQVIRLIATLGAHTSTPNRCYFAIWTGADLRTSDRAAPVVRIGNRDMVLLSGPIEAATTLSEPGHFQSPSLWWPEDHAWCVATDPDLDSTYVGGGRECVEALTADDHLEALPIAARDSVTRNSDTLNAAEAP
ncbi:hypothetical protein [Actinoplanes sp. NPDC020271]|uniref:hypothetical protein n=1 Tax=Actinoplanes sp. NPDC020271 TaxID=3363896 RepID=UPI0037BBA31D